MQKMSQKVQESEFLKHLNTVDFKYKGQKVFGDFDQMSLVPG